MVADDTKARIRAVAMELFAAQGYERTSLREIAERVGMTKASLYYHYPSKQALLLALIQPLVDEWRDEVQAAEQEPYAASTVRVALGRMIDTMIRHRDACGIVMRDTPALASVKSILQEMMQVATRLHSWLAGPHPTDVDRIRAVAASEVLGGAVSSVVSVSDVSPVVLRQTLLDCAMGVLGMGPGPGEVRSEERGDEDGPSRPPGASGEATQESPESAPDAPPPVASGRVPVNSAAGAHR